METTIPASIGRIKAALDAHFGQKSYAWKTRESQGEHEQAKPTVYALVCAQRTAIIVDIINESMYNMRFNGGCFGGRLWQTKSCILTTSNA